jgi:hypothetical protein
MAAITTPYASGTITSVTGTTVVISGGAVAGWVGRCIRLTTGTGAGQTRRITAFVSATQITIDYAFANTYTSGVLAGLVDVDPAGGDGFVISYAPADIADATTIIVDPGTNVMRFVGASSFAGGAFLYLPNWRIELTSTTITTTSALVADRCAWRCGDVDAAGNFFNGSYLLDLATSASGFNPTGGVGMDFEYYGGLIRCTGAAPFWRFHTHNEQRVRICGVRVNGTIGGRMQGARSVHGDWEVYGNTSASGPFNAKAQFGRITGIRVSQSLQAVYHYWPDSMTLTIEGIQLGPNVSRGVRFANINTAGQRLTIRDIDIASWSALPLLYQNDSSTYINDFRISQFVGGGYRNAAGVAVTDSTRFVLRDNVPATIYNATATDGLLPQQEVRYRDMVVQNSGGYTWASAGGTTFAPYELAAISYLWQPATAVMPLLNSTSPSLLALPDANVSQTNKATVDAYTEINTLDRLYDRAKSWTCDNLALANPSFGAQVAVGNGTELNLGGFDLVVDATAASAFAITGNTLTIKATTLAAGSKFATLRTTGTLTLLNGAAMGISYTTGAGSFAAISVSGLTAGSWVQLKNLTTSMIMYSALVAGTSYSGIFPWAGNDSVRLRVSKMGLMDYEQVLTYPSSGLAFTASTPVDPIYVTNGVDGSTVTEFVADFPNVEVEINDGDGTTTVQRLHAWYHYIAATSDGIENFFGGIEAQSTSKYLINTGIVNLKINAITPIILRGGIIYRDDGQSIRQTGSQTIEMLPDEVYVAGIDAISTLISELHALQGLKAGSPMTVTPTTRTADGITLNITGDGTTTTTVTRA